LLLTSTETLSHITKVRNWKRFRGRTFSH